MTESELKAKVVELAHLRGWKVFSLPMVKNIRPVKSAVGYPDLTLARNQQVLWLELKQSDGVLSLEQLDWLRNLPWCHVIRPLDWEDGTVQRLLR